MPSKPRVCSAVTRHPNGPYRFGPLLVLGSLVVPPWWPVRLETQMDRSGVVTLGGTSTGNTCGEDERFSLGTAFGRIHSKSVLVARQGRFRFCLGGPTLY